MKTMKHVCLRLSWCNQRCIMFEATGPVCSINFECTAGKDATEEFEYYGHSNKAREHMQQFEVGAYEVCCISLRTSALLFGKRGLANSYVLTSCKCYGTNCCCSSAGLYTLVAWFRLQFVTSPLYGSRQLVSTWACRVQHVVACREGIQRQYRRHK